VAEDGNKDDGRSQAGLRNDAEQTLEKHVQEARAFHDANAKSSHYGHAQRGEVHEVLNGRYHELEQILGAEHVQYADGLAGTGVFIIKRHEGKGKGQDAGNHQGINKKHGDVRQFVACGFHGVQEAVERAAGLLDVRRHVDSLND